MSFTTNLKAALKNVEICFVSVGTPMGADGSADLKYVMDVAKNIGRYMENHLVVVDKSTVPVGTADKVREAIQKEIDNRSLDIPFDVASNPEFLKEGAAIEVFMHPDRIVIGSESDKTINLVNELYRPFMTKNSRLIAMDTRSAEMTKYAANAMLATKISYMNEIANICERVGADVNSVRQGVGSDNRIGFSFIYPGCGYGGSCFTKDLQALFKTSKDFGYTAQLLTATENVNNSQKKVIVNKVVKRFGTNLNGFTFAIWGLSFKPETDDMRATTSITVIEELTALGANIKAYDPRAIDEAKSFYLKDNSSVEYKESKYSVLNGCEALILLTEWKEFRSPDFDEVKKRLTNIIIFDGRN